LDATYECIVQAKVTRCRHRLKAILILEVDAREHVLPDWRGFEPVERGAEDESNVADFRVTSLIDRELFVVSEGLVHGPRELLPMVGRLRGVGILGTLRRHVSRERGTTRWPLNVN
jgi:hypothetical protein